jgi:hypothetical protein
LKRKNGGHQPTSSGVAHDFNNILAIIIGYSELITDISQTSVRNLPRRFGWRQIVPLGRRGAALYLAANN